jgi:hypothetical protein
MVKNHKNSRRRGIRDDKMTAERARLGRGLTVPEEAYASFLHDYFY